MVILYLSTDSFLCKNLSCLDINQYNYLQLEAQITKRVRERWNLTTAYRLFWYNLEEIIRKITSPTYSAQVEQKKVPTHSWVLANLNSWESSHKINNSGRAVLKREVGHHSTKTNTLQPESTPTILGICRTIAYLGQE